MKKTFFSYSFGCRVNQAEKESLDQQLYRYGFISDNHQPALYIINTCAVTAKAEREARQLIYQLKRKNPKAKIIVTGCSATLWLKKHLTLLEADLYLDNKHKARLADQIIQGYFPTGKYLTSSRLLVKIQDGCHRFCTYCITAYLRGKPKSRPIRAILEQIKPFSDQIKEIVLTAINTEAYGQDTKESLVGLTKTLINNTDIPRISFGSIHPWSVNKEFLSFYKNYLPKKCLVNFFHIPLQSGSDKILKLMKRNYTSQEFLKKLNRIKKINPNAFIATDVIVGFLGETDKEFKETVSFLKKAPISRFHIFRFSDRPDTAAYFMKNKIQEPTSQEKVKRAKVLSLLSNQKYLEFLRQNVGRTSSALFLVKKVGEYQEALLDNQLPILVKTNKSLAGQIKNVKILSVKNNCLIGKLI